jgi:hypothetical protein
MRRRLCLAASPGLLFDTPWRAGAQNRVPHLAYFWLGAKGSDGETLKGFQAGLRDFGEQGKTSSSIISTAMAARRDLSNHRWPRLPCGPM